MNPTHKISCSLILTTILSILCINSAMATPFQINIVNQKLTLQAEKASIREIFEAIDQLSNIQIYFNSSKDETISANLKNIPIHLGLKQLIRNYSHAFIFEQGERASEERVKSLFIYAKTGNTSSSIVWQAEKKIPQPAPPPTIASLPDSIHPNTPMTENPMISMQAIDPLMRFEAPPGEGHAANPLFGNPHENHLKAIIKK